MLSRYPANSLLHPRPIRSQPNLHRAQEIGMVLGQVRVVGGVRSEGGGEGEMGFENVVAIFLVVRKECQGRAYSL